MPSRLPHHAVNAAYGSYLACTGCIRALFHAEFRRSYHGPILWILLSTFAIAIAAHVVAFPIHVVLWLVGLSTLKDMLSNALYRSIAAVPFLCVAASRYVYPALFERLFMLGVAIQNPSLASTLAKIQVDYFTWEYASSVLLFQLYRVVLLLVLGTGSLIFTPLFGGLFAMVAFSYRVRRMELAFALSLLVLYLVPMTRPTALTLVRLWFDSRAIARELFTPFVDRQTALKELNIPGLDPHRAGVPVLKWPQCQAILFGFSYTLSYLMQISYFGPFVWLLGSVAAGHVTALLLERGFTSSAPQKLN